MKNKIILILAFTISFLITTYAFSQVIATDRIGWDQIAPSLADAQGYTYRYYPDAVTTGTILTPVVCSGTTSPFVCSAAFPAFTPGAHTLTLTAANIAGESGKSSVYSFTMEIIPNAPSNIRHIRGGQ